MTPKTTKLQTQAFLDVDSVIVDLKPLLLGRKKLAEKMICMDEEDVGLCSKKNQIDLTNGLIKKILALN